MSGKEEILDIVEASEKLSDFVSNMQKEFQLSEEIIGEILIGIAFSLMQDAGRTSDDIIKIVEDFFSEFPGGVECAISQKH